MKFSYAPNNNNFFATNLKLNKEKLKWDTGTGGTTLIFQCRFGMDLLPEMEGICEKLSQMSQPPGAEFVSLAPEYPFVFVCMLDARQKIKQGGCAVRGEVCRYAVFACRVNGEECTVFEPKRAYTVDIPAEISVTYAKVYDRIKARFSRKVKEEFAGFYEVAFEGGKLSGYKDGDIFYKVNEIRIPITGAMIQAECFYIKAQEMPQLETKSEGYNISMREIQ